MFQTFETFNIFGETYDCIIEIHEGETTRSGRITQPELMIEQQFISLTQQAAQSSIPIKFTISRVDKIWDELEQEFKTVTYSMGFMNNPWLAEHEEDRCG